MMTLKACILAVGTIRNVCATPALRAYRAKRHVRSHATKPHMRKHGKCQNIKCHKKVPTKAENAKEIGRKAQKACSNKISTMVCVYTTWALSAYRAKSRE